MHQDIDDLQRRCAALRNSPLKDIITRENETDFFTPEQTEKDYSEITNSDYFSLLKYLLRMGYIDETHADYMTYFYENSLCASDKIFLRSVTDQKAKEAEYSLKDPRLVFSRLRPMQFLQEEALNYDLLDYLLESESHSESTANLFAQLRDRENYDFVVAYYDRAEKKNRFVQSANNLWPELFSELVEQDNVFADLLKDYSVRTLYICTEEVISAVNKDDALADFISNKEDYLHIENPQTEKLLDGFRLLSVSFEELDTAASDPTLLDKVYDEGLYRLNYINIATFLRDKLPEPDDAAIRERNYTLVRKMKDSPLYIKIHEDIEAYIQVILENCGETIKDSEDAILAILNCDEISEEAKKRYIRCLSSPASITTLRDVTSQELWSELLQSDTLMGSEENILDYYEYVGSITPELSAFINRSLIQMQFKQAGSNYSEELMSSFFDEFVSNVDIEDDHYRQTLCNFDRQIPAFTECGLPQRRIEMLIADHILPMNAGNLHFIRQNYPDSILSFITKNLDAYLELMTDELFSTDELLAILDMPVADEKKLHLLAFAHGPIPTVGKYYSPEVKCRILQDNMVLEEMPSYFEYYQDEAEQVRQCIYEYAVTNPDLLAGNTIRTSDVLLRRVLESSINTEEKVRILASCALSREQEEFKAYLTLVGIKGLEKVFLLPPGRSFQITTPYQAVLEAMKQRGWVQKLAVTNSHQYRVTVA